jgi:hypothetical protein
MFKFHSLSSETLAFLTLGLAIGAVAPLVILASGAVVAAPTSEASFPDIQNHWASPFIEPLAEKNILAGYLDGTYRPNQPVQRDEFAAVIRKAFNQEPIRKIASGSVYKDVPSDYWAASAIEEAYQTGFMTGYPGGVFRPNKDISRVEALVALEKNLDSSLTSPTPSATQTTNQAATNQSTTQATTQPVTTRRATKKRLFIPLAMTTLMQPLVTAPANSQSMPANNSPSSVASDKSVSPTESPSSVASDKGVSPSNSPSLVASNQGLSSTRPASFTVSNYYADAKEIPYYAVGNVAAATKANIVVNYPNQQILNPTQPATRGDIAAFIYQALVAQGKIEPLPSSVEASKYIVNRPTNSNQKTQTAQ